MRPLPVFEHGNQFLDQARQGIVLDVLLIHPLISGRKNGFAFRLSEEKVGKQHTVGEHMLHIVGQQR